jgi:hypothetical protein
MKNTRIADKTFNEMYAKIFKSILLKSSIE